MLPLGTDGISPAPAQSDGVLCVAAGLPARGRSPARTACASTTCATSSRRRGWPRATRRTRPRTTSGMPAKPSPWRSTPTSRRARRTGRRTSPSLDRGRGHGAPVRPPAAPGRPMRVPSSEESGAPGAEPGAAARAAVRSTRAGRSTRRSEDRRRGRPARRGEPLAAVPARTWYFRLPLKGRIAAVIVDGRGLSKRSDPRGGRRWGFAPKGLRPFGMWLAGSNGCHGGAGLGRFR